MNAYKFAPKIVIDSLSSVARNIIESRMKDGELKPYISMEYNIRIRGIKPSILYTHFTTLTANNILELMYVVDAEEEQCKWINSTIQIINKLDRVELFMNAMTEISWCNWEDKFMSGQPIIPLNHLHGYKDIMNNSFMR